MAKETTLRSFLGWVCMLINNTPGLWTSQELPSTPNVQVMGQMGAPGCCRNASNKVHVNPGKNWSHNNKYWKAKTFKNFKFWKWVFSLAVKISVSHIRVPGFNSWLPSSCQCRPCETAVLAQVNRKIVALSRAIYAIKIHKWIVFLH